jgi:hypothetical protein
MTWQSSNWMHFIQQHLGGQFHSWINLMGLLWLFSKSIEPFCISSMTHPTIVNQWRLTKTLFARERGFWTSLMCLWIFLLVSCAKNRMVSQDNLLNHICHLNKLTLSAKSFIISRKLQSKVARGEHYGLAICIKSYLKAKEELWKLKYFTLQKYNVQTIL